MAWAWAWLAPWHCTRGGMGVGVVTGADQSGTRPCHGLMASVATWLGSKTLCQPLPPISSLVLLLTLISPSLVKEKGIQGWLLEGGILVFS